MSRRHELRTLLRGALRPPENDSAFLLDVHRRAVPRERMARYDDSFSVDLVIVGAGAGGGTLAQRLARRGWKVVVLESGPFWDPDQDWVSDEAGSHRLYWTDDRVTGGSDPVELGKNNCGHGVGGSMVHYAGYCPRFHPSDFEVRSRDGVGEDWPIRYPDLKRHYERLELELPVAGDFWPWGDPHRYPHTPHPIAGGADAARGGARKLGIEMRVGPVGITNGAFGNRPHCIYRGYCLQGCKVNAKASPLVTHIPDAIEHGAEIRARLHGRRGRVLDDASGRVTGVRYLHEGSERFQRAEAVAVAGYSIETPRLLLNSTSRRFPHGLANNNDQVGRCVMVQGAPQVAGRFPDEMRMYKAPPPEISSEQFYETDPQRGFARGFSIQTVGPLPIEHAQHVLGHGHWGHGAARVHARLQPLVHARRAVRAAAAARQPRDDRRTARPTRTGFRWRGWTTRSATTTARTSRSPSRPCTTSSRRQARRTCSRPTATRTSSAAAGWAPTPSAAWSMPTTARGRSPTCSSPTAA